MKKLIIIFLVILGCSKANDPQPIPKDFPAPSIIGTWKLAYENITNCGSSNGTVSGTSNQKLILTYTKSTDGNYKATYQGSDIEYQLQSDSIFLFVPKYTDGVYQGMTGWKKGKFQISNTLQITGKFTIQNQLTGCNFFDYFQH